MIDIHTRSHVTGRLPGQLVSYPLGIFVGVSVLVAALAVNCCDVGDDYEADMARMAADPTTQEWWAEMEEVFHAD